MSDISGAPAAAPSAQSSTPESASTPSTEPKVNTANEGSEKKEAAPKKEPEGKEGSEKQPAEKKEGESKKTEQTEAEKREEARRKYKLKVNGKEMERELTDSEIQRRLQLSYAADEKFQEAAMTKKQLETFVETLRRDPMSVLTHPELGINFRELAEQYLTGEVKKELMSPEERELEELREYKRKQDEDRTKSEQEKQTKAQEEQLKQYKERAAKFYDTKITEVLSQSDLPKTPYTVKRVAEVLYSALQKGYDLDIPTAVDIVREGYQTDISQLYGSLDGEKLVKMLGEDISKKLSKHHLAQIKQKLAKANGQDSPADIAEQKLESPAAKREPKQKHMNRDEWLEFVRKKAGV